ncbi:MAG TPA: glycosyltransferase, partial [Acidiferrobacteraceae bacterium]|nr:glycosyltransferase [Acidiferrobacteraceae bacterium]
MESIWSRMTPQFIVYLITLGFRLVRFYTLTALGIEKRFMAFRNIEGNKDYDFKLPNKVDVDGVTAIIRAKNEEDKIGLCLGSIYDIFDRIVVIDNGSDDRTRGVVEDFKKKYDSNDKLTIASYPFKLARNGPEHEATDENSLHSIVYFSNYSLSLCKRMWVCKWDADMVLRAEERDIFSK